MDAQLAAGLVNAANVPRFVGGAFDLADLATDGYELEVGFWLADPENGQGGPISDVNRKIYALVHSGALKLGDRVMAYFGELHPEIVAAADLKGFDAVHRDCLARLPGVSAIRTSFAIRRIRDWRGYRLRDLPI